MRRTGLVWHERYMWHDTGSGTSELPSGGWLEPHIHAENPDTKRRLKNLLDASGLTEQLVALPPRPATVDELCRVHGLAYIEQSKFDSAVMKIGREVVVIGAGNTAIDCATIARRLGADRVTMV